ncbi:MAG TPA: hypothetical protein VF479_08960 [Pseudolysinimonas sp.]
MTVRTLAIAALVAVALSGCTAASNPTPPEDAICDPFLLTGSMNGDLTATATGLGDPGFPLDRVVASGITPDCTARLAVVAADGTTLDLDVALVNVPIADLADQLDDITGEDGWARDPAETIWRASNGGGYLLALEIEEGVLLCDAPTGAVPQAWLPHG